jgi:essential nuclear protein 1
MPKAATSDSRQQRRHNPLHEELIESSDGGHLRKVARNKRKEKQDKPEDYVDSGLSKRILQLAKEQQDEIEEEREAAAAVGQQLPGNGVAFLGAAGHMRVEEEESDDEGDYEDYEFGDEEEVEEVEVEEGDEELFNRFLPQGQPEQRISLADKILEKIAEHEAKLAGARGNPQEQEVPQLPPKVIEVYTKYCPAFLPLDVP